MVNIEKIFDSLKKLSKENEVIVNSISKVSYVNARLSDLDGSLRELVTKSISNIKKEIINVQEFYAPYAPCVNQVQFTKSKVALKGTEEKQHENLKLNMDKYDAFFEMILRSEISVDQMELFVEGYISVIYTGLQLNHKKLIKPMPKLQALLQCS